jgi:hypothetical protein
MARRTTIIDAFRTHLATELTNDVAQVSKQYQYMDEINDFPAITFIARNEAREHRGAGRKLAVLRIDLRLYAYDRDIGELDLLTRKCEDAINTFENNATALAEQVDIVQVVTVSGDEGLMRPYQVADIQILITYDVEIT